jgi:hypothetical protein
MFSCAGIVIRWIRLFVMMTDRDLVRPTDYHLEFDWS